MMNRNNTRKLAVRLVENTETNPRGPWLVQQTRYALPAEKTPHKYFFLRHICGKLFTFFKLKADGTNCEHTQMPLFKMFHIIV